MGQKHSNTKVSAQITIHGYNSFVDGLTLSYKRNSCCSRRRVVAAFTFPKGGWQQVSEGILQNRSSKGVNVPLEKLSKKDGDTSVRITCLAEGFSVYKTQLSLADLVKRLGYTVRGKEAFLFFSLTGAKVEGAKVHVFTTLFCNGKRCGEAPRVEAPCRAPAEVGKEVEDEEGMEDSPGLRGDGQGLEEIPGLDEDGEGMEDSPGLGGEGQGLEECPGLDEDGKGMEDGPDSGKDAEGKDMAPAQEEEAVLRQPTPQEREERYNEEVPASPYYYVATPSSYGSGGQGRGDLMNTLGVCATVVVFLLMFYNAWLEWNTA